MTEKKDAAVLVLVYRDADGKVRVVLVVRGARGVHGNQIGLPGGKPEPLDRSALDTALRETDEEIGLGVADVQVLAALDPVEARTTGFRVVPFLARVPASVRWRARTGEIADVITPRIEMLLDPSRRRNELLSFATWPEPRLTECVEVHGHLIWGLTLRLLDAVAPRVLAGEWDV